jgi:formiminotetrahydrofolate cyclodeaminase
MSQEAQKDETTVTQFLDAVAAGSATPGGGSVAALAGCLGSALVEMVVNLTSGKKAYAAEEEELKRIREEAYSYRQSLVATIEKDIAAYQGVMNAYLLPKTSDEEKRKRREEIQNALRKAADPPLFTAATSLKLMKLCQEALQKGNPNAASDAAVGALMADAALRGGVFNVLVNLSALDDKKYVERMKKELRRLEQESGKIKGQIMLLVTQKILPR